MIERGLKMKKAKRLLGMLLAAFVFVGCSVSPADTTTSEKEEMVTIRVSALSGPTAMGMVKLMKDAKENATENTYSFGELSTDPAAFVAGITKGDIDICAVPSNLAANLYNKTNGEILVLAANVYGVVSIVERGENSITSFQDLKGHTIYATGQGAVPEYTLRYLLEKNELDSARDVDIRWCADTTEALSVSTTVSVSVSAASSVLSATSTTTACCPLRLSAVPASAKADNVDGIINAMTHIADINFFIFLYSFVVSISVIIISYSSLPVAPSKCNLFSQIYGYFS